MWVEPVPKEVDFRSELSWCECSMWSHMQRPLLQPGSRHLSLHVAHVIAGFLTTHESKLIQITPQHKHTWTFFHRFKLLSLWSGVSDLCLSFLCLSLTSMNILDFAERYILILNKNWVQIKFLICKYSINWFNSYIKRHPLLFMMFIKVILLEHEFCIIPLVWHEKHIFIAQIKVASS